jgi:hypothetical protein
VDQATKLRHALKAAGFLPLPCEGKATYVSGWTTKTDVSAAEIDLWERLYPSARNTGVLTRMTPTLDIDIRNPEAAEAIEAIARERFEERGYILVRIGQPPKRAIPFRTDAPFKKITRNLTALSGSVGEKIELMGDGQQIVVAGIHPETKKPYRWHGGEPGRIKWEDLPYITATEASSLVEDAVKLLVTDFGYTATPPKGNGADHPGSNADWTSLLAAIRDGRELHDATRDLAAKLVASGMNEGGAVNLLRAVYECSPAPHDDRWRDRFADIPRAVSGARGFGDQQREPELHWHGDASETMTRAWLVDGLLPESGTGLISGQWGTYKTFAALDLSGAVMAGLAFIDYPVARRGGVLFIASEGAFEIPVRLEAVLTEKFPDVGRVPFAWVSECPRLLAPGAGNVLAAIACRAAARMKSDFELPLALIIIDTLVDAAGFAKPGDENDAAVNQIIMGRLADLARQTGALVLGIDHFGKAVETGTRGSSAKEGRADVVLALLGEKSVTGKVTNTRLAIRKNRSGPSGREHAFTVRVVDLGANPEPITSLVIDWGGEPAKTKGDDEDGWTKSLTLLRRILMNVLASDAARNHRPFLDGPVVRAVDIEIVRVEFYKSHPADGDAKAKQATRRQAFHRAIRLAQQKKLIGVWEVEGITLVWLGKNDPPQNA